MALFGRGHKSEADTSSGTREEALHKALSWVDENVDSNVVGRNAVYGKFDHNKGKHIGGRTVYDDGSTAVVREDSDEYGNSFDARVENKDGRRSSHHRWGRK